jgi:flagellar biosynthesis/type III secretory pathway protein FliH
MDITFEDYPSYEIGMENGLQQGLQQGEVRGKIKAFYELGFDVKEIAKRVNKPEEEIITIINTRR